MPERIGRYRIHERIATGGMAEVFDATSTGEQGFERRVAIKRMIPDRAADASFSRMFIDEARIAARLHHANIVAVLDYGVLDGQPFQVLEFVEGVDARELHRVGDEAGHPMSLEVALFIAGEVAHALDYAHAATDSDGNPLGIVHRDVTPTNVLVSWAGEVKLADFGIALATDRTEKTQDGLTKGKLAYMSPEQATAGHVDLRSDVFALGCTLHTLCTGRSPLTGPDAFRALLSGESMRLDPGLPDDVRSIVEKATHAERAERYATAAELAADISTALRGRVEDDPRLVMRKWLALLRPSERHSPPAAALFDVEILADPLEPRKRTYRATTRVATPHRPKDGAHAATGESIAHETASVRLPTHRGRLSSLVGVVIVLLVGTGAGIWALSGASAPRSDEQTPPQPPVEEPELADPSEEPAPPVDDADEPELQAELEIAAQPSPPPVRPDPHSRGPVTAAPPADDPPPHVEAHARDEPRYLRIAGVSTVGAVVTIDGSVRGTAPGTFQVSEGSHTVEVASASGDPIGSRTVNVTAAHVSAGSAARVIFR